MTTTPNPMLEDLYTLIRRETSVHYDDETLSCDGLNSKVPWCGLVRVALRLLADSRSLQDPGTAAAMRVLLEELLWLANNLDRASSSIWIMRACDTLCSAAHAKRKAEKEAHP